LALFRLLVTAGPAGLSAGVIAERLGVQPSSLCDPAAGCCPDATGKATAAA
jgi:hypothetical protein